jgi:hypothetical protein
VADARTGRRFPLELPVRLHVPDSAEEPEAVTANVSAAGVYIKAKLPNSSESPTGEVAWRRGALVDFEMMLPAGVIGAERDVKIHCRGRVVRVESVSSQEEGDRRHGVACVIDKYEFVRNS